MRKILSLLISFIFSMGISVAQDTTSLAKKYSLSECVSMGIERNFNVLIKREQQIISDNNATKGNAGMLPILDLSSGASGQINNNYSDRTDTGFDKSRGEFSEVVDAGLNVSWMIFDGLKAQATYARLNELKSIGELNSRISIEDTAAEIASVYYQIIRQKIRLKNLKAALDLSKERLRIVGERLSLKSASLLEYQQAEVDYNADNSRYIKQMEIVYSYQVQLNELIANDDFKMPVQIADYSIKLLPMTSKDELWQKTMNTNLSLLLAEKDKRVSEEDLRIAKSRSYPYLKFNTGYGYSSNWYNTAPLKQRQQAGLNYGITLGVNIFDGMNRRREQNNAKTQIRISELQKESLEMSLKADMSNLWMAYTNNLNLISLETNNVKTAQQYFDIAMERYKLGEYSGIELREAQNSLLAAEERLSTAEYDTKICEISLFLLSGDILSVLL